MKKWIGITLFSTVLLVAFNLAAEPGLARIAKLTASTAFILTAISAGATGTRYGKWILAGLFFSWWGDAFLTMSSDLFFQLGLGSFLLGHLLYCGAFLAHGINTKWALASFVAMIPFAAGVLSWLWPHVDNSLQVPVGAYILVISTMVILAVGTQGRGGPRFILIGAILFYFSDISVAHGRFMESDFPMYVWGLPFYFVGQLFLAVSPMKVEHLQKIEKKR